MTNEPRTPSPHICPSCKASFTDDGEFGAHMGGRCTPSPADGRVLLCTDPVCPADDPHNQGALGCHFARSPDAPGSVAGAVPSPALSSEWKERAGGDHASGSRSRHGEGAPADGIDARGLVERLRRVGQYVRYGSNTIHGETVDEAADHIEAQSATIAQLNAEVERMGWQPIDTAPHEVEVLAIRAGAKIPFVASCDDDGWFTFNGALENVGKKFEPTHWMPLDDLLAALAPKEG